MGDGIVVIEKKRDFGKKDDEVVKEGGRIRRAFEWLPKILIHPTSPKWKKCCARRNRGKIQQYARDVEEVCEEESKVGNGWNKAHLGAEIGIKLWKRGPNCKHKV